MLKQWICRQGCYRTDDSFKYLWIPCRYLALRAMFK